MTDNQHLDGKREALGLLAKTATEAQLDTAIHAIISTGAASPVAAIPLPAPAQSPVPAVTKPRRKAELPSAPVSAALRRIGRGKPEDILAWFQQQPNVPMPHDPQEAAAWVNRAVSRMGRKLRKWPDGSYSLLAFKPELVAS